MKTSCRVCHRPLTDPASVQRGIGPVCAGKGVEGPDLFERETVLPDDPDYFVFERRENGVAVSIPRAHVHHSPTGFEWNYGGSGPADLALNIMAYMLPRQDGDEGMKLWDGSVISTTAARLYQKFKWAFIAPLPEEGGKIGKQLVRDWISQRERCHALHGHRDESL